MSSLTKVLQTHKQLTSKAFALVARKGKDYNRKQQQSGDTLFNLSVSKLLGIVDYTTASILVRLSDKFMRLVSLTSNPKEQPEIKSEKVEDTIVDMINYLVYLYVKYQEERK
jgi:hypothetical protein